MEFRAASVSDLPACLTLVEARLQPTKAGQPYHLMGVCVPTNLRPRVVKSPD